MALYDRGKATLHGLAIGTTGTIIKGITAGTVSVNPADAATGHEQVSTDVTITGTAVGDMVLMEAPSDLEDDLVFSSAVVTGANTVAVNLYAGAAVDGAAKTWRYLWIDLT